MYFQGCKNVNRLGVRVETTSCIISYNNMASFSTFLASPYKTVSTDELPSVDLVT
jgi:hypothetical protein